MDREERLAALQVLKLKCPGLGYQFKILLENRLLTYFTLCKLNAQVAKAKEADFELDMFASYEEYLDSKLEEAQRRQDAIDRAYHRLQLLWSLDPGGPLLTDKEFSRAKEALGPEEKATKRGNRDFSQVVPRLEQVCQEESKDEHLLLYLHVVHESGAEVSGHIDLTDRLTDPDFLPELRHRGGL